MDILRRYKRDDRGTVLVFVAMCLVVILGLAALTFDLGRLAATQTDLQSYADNVALSAAGELDGASDAIARASAAAEDMIRDSQTFADGAQDLGTARDYSLRFLTGLPDDDTASLAPYVTTDPTEAALVEVTVTPRRVFLPFSRAMAALAGLTAPNESVNAVAVAGFSQWACDITPLMFCVPSDYEADAHIGDTIQLRSGGSGAAWGPGDFGFLDPSKIKVDPNGPCAGLNGVNLDACLIAASGNVTQCFAQRGVDTEPGQKAGIENAIFNTRFDMFTGIMTGKRSNPHYAPGPHVIKGLVPQGGGSCAGTNANPSPDTVPFPPDDCFSAGTCPTGGGRIGNGSWAGGRATYVATNYGAGNDPDPQARTRYQLYLSEIGKAAGGAILTGRAETGRPSCSTAPTIQDPDRRVFVAAGIDCDANPINGAETHVPVKEFFKIFLLQPVGNSTVSPPVFDLWVEVVGSAGGAGSSVENGYFRDVVVLYR